MASAILQGRWTDQRVVFLGDSTVRYLYLTMVNIAAAPSKASVTGWSLCTRYCYWNEHTWLGWSEFYRGTSLANASYCDCYRADGTFLPSEMMENRFNEVGGAALDYFQLLDINAPLRGTWWPGDPDALRTAHKAWAPSWQLQLEIASKTLFAAMKPTAFVVNVGHHLSRNSNKFLGTYDDAKLAVVYERLSRALHALTPNVIWVTSIGNHAVHGNGLRMEHRVIPKHFRNIFNTSTWLAALRGTEHFYDGNLHLQVNDNIALACGLMETLHQDLIPSTGAKHICGEDGRAGVASHGGITPLK